MATLDDLVRKAKQQIADNSNSRERTTKIPQGKSRWRILPSWRKDKGDVTFFHATGTHFIKDSNMNLRVVVSCVHQTYEQDCPICNALEVAVSKAETDQEIKVLKEAMSRRTFLVNALRTDTGEKTPVILEMPQTTFGQVLDNIEEHGPIFDPEDGLDIVIERTGTGFNTEYSVVVASKLKSAPVPKSALMQLNDLDAYVKQETESRLGKAMAVIGSITGAPMAESTRKALTPPKDEPEVEAKKKKKQVETAEDAEYTEVEETEAEEVEDEATEEEKAAAEEEFEQELDDDELKALIDDL